MTSADLDIQATAADGRHRALLAVSEAILSHRDLSALFHELAGRLHQVVRFDYLALMLHDAVGNTLRLHVLESDRVGNQDPYLIGVGGVEPPDRGAD